MKYFIITLTIFLLHSSVGLLQAQPTVDFVSGNVLSSNKKIRKGSQLDSNARIKTSAKTKAQVSANGMFVRAGSKTDFFLKEKANELSLKRGLAFVSPDGKQAKKSFKLDAGHCKVRSQGSALISYIPDEYVKITCIEGKMKVKLAAFLGDSVNLKAGEMLVTTPTDKKLAAPKLVNLQKLVASGALFNNSFPNLPSALNSRIVDSMNKNRQLVYAFRKPRKPENIHRIPKDIDESITSIQQVSAINCDAIFQELFNQSTVTARGFAGPGGEYFPFIPEGIPQECLSSGFHTLGEGVPVLPFPGAADSPISVKN